MHLIALLDGETDIGTQVILDFFGSIKHYGTFRSSFQSRIEVFGRLLGMFEPSNYRPEISHFIMTVLLMLHDGEIPLPSGIFPETDPGNAAVPKTRVSRFITSLFSFASKNPEECSSEERTLLGLFQSSISSFGMVSIDKFLLAAYELWQHERAKRIKDLYGGFGDMLRSIQHRGAPYRLPNYLEVDLLVSRVHPNPRWSVVCQVFRALAMDETMRDIIQNIAKSDHASSSSKSRHYRHQHHNYGSQKQFALASSGEDQQDPQDQQQEWDPSFLVPIFESVGLLSLNAITSGGIIAGNNEETSLRLLKPATVDGYCRPHRRSTPMSSSLASHYDTDSIRNNHQRSQLDTDDNLERNATVFHGGGDDARSADGEIVAFRWSLLLSTWSSNFSSLMEKLDSLRSSVSHSQQKSGELTELESLCDIMIAVSSTRRNIASYITSSYCQRPFLSACRQSSRHAYYQHYHYSII